ncbi:MAG: DNA repair protein RadA [Gammaproteobacteria bacterium]|nr:DNA repair protein RadA [Gammaproteobacteria bacterium]
MPAKDKRQYQCQSCGAAAPKWSGQCPECGEWNTLVEIVVTAGAGAGRRAGYGGDADGRGRVQSLSDVELVSESRLAVGFAELERVLGGGLVAGSVILIGGDPGIGKSTLLLQAMVAAQQSLRLPALYVTGEESPQQVKLRAERLGLDAGGLRLLAETQVEQILTAAQKEKPRIMVVDSVQTVHTDLLQSAPGSVAQVRESSAQLVQYAKQTGTALFLVGHVTKEGTLAGPRVLEHMVDTVLYFESDSGSRYRVIRAIKNRFGAVNELGVFAMTDRGLREVGNPSAIFLSRHEEPVSGSVIMVTREGSRPLLVEAQALVDESHLANPRRVTQGLDSSRLAMLLAVLHRHGGIATYDQDVFVNVVGGVRISETGADLPVLLAVLSSLRNRLLPSSLVTFGEVGLAGEIRPVQGGEDRLREASKHGFRHAVVPRSNAPKQPLEGMEVTAVGRLDEAIDAVMG